jgi:hypothetical protein
MTGGVVYMHKWHIRAAQKISRKYVCLLKNSSPNRNHGKTKPNKKKEFFFKRIWDVGFPV